MDNRNFVLSAELNSQFLNTQALIPAYDKNNNGIIFGLLIEAVPGKAFNVSAHGCVAIGLKKMLGRVVSVMTSLESSWKILDGYSYNLVSLSGQFRVMDARSAGLPLCIALINIVRVLNGLQQVQHLTGTGILRIDGTFEKSHLEEEKKQASSQLMENRFINSQVCKHVFDLANLMNDQKKGES